VACCALGLAKCIDKVADLVDQVGDPAVGSPGPTARPRHRQRGGRRHRGIVRSKAYELATSDDSRVRSCATVHRYLVPTGALLALLGAESGPPAPPAPAELCAGIGLGAMSCGRFPTQAAKK
jgi:hypothetical protein